MVQDAPVLPLAGGTGVAAGICAGVAVCAAKATGAGVIGVGGAVGIGPSLNTGAAAGKGAGSGVGVGLAQPSRNRVARRVRKNAPAKMGKWHLVRLFVNTIASGVIRDSYLMDPTTLNVSSRERLLITWVKLSVSGSSQATW